MDGWTIRLIAAAALTLSGAAGGRALGMARRLRAEQLRELSGAIDRLVVEMLERMLPLREALAAAHHPAFDAVAGRLTGARPVQEAWLAAREGLSARGGPMCCLEEEEMGVLGRLFAGLGASGASEQRLLIREAGAQLARLEALARAKADEQAKLYSTLGLLSGLALSVCLL